jgi:predicted DNA-binding ribbon-helix-helix protein
MKKISISISGHSTSFSLEDEFCDALKKIAAGRGQTMAGLIREIDSARDSKHNLSSAVRVFVLKSTESHNCSGKKIE